MPVEDRDAEVRLLTLGYFAAPVRFDGRKQAGEQVWPSPADLVEKGHGADQTGEPAFFRRVQAQKADDIAGIGVVSLAFTCLVQPRRVSIAEVLDVPEQVAFRVLRPQVPPVRA